MTAAYFESNSQGLPFTWSTAIWGPEKHNTILESSEEICAYIRCTDNCLKTQLQVRNLFFLYNRLDSKFVNRYGKGFMKGKLVYVYY